MEYVNGKIKMKTARTEAELTQAEVAEKMRLSKKTIVAWENGKVIPKPAQFEMFCRICGFTPDQIFLPSELTIS